MIAQQFRQLNVYCRHLYFMKTGHDINCCVFKARECIVHYILLSLVFVIVGLAQWYDRRPLSRKFVIEGSNPHHGIFLSLLFDNLFL